MTGWRNIFGRRPRNEEPPAPPRPPRDIEIEQCGGWLRRALSYEDPKYPNIDFYERLVIMARQNDELMASMEKGFVSHPMAEKIVAAGLVKLAHDLLQPGGTRVESYIVDDNTIRNSHSRDLYTFAWAYVDKEIRNAITNGTEQYNSTPSFER